jgi:hypothetical protein
VYASVTDNTQVDPWDFTFNGGIASYMIDQVFTSSNGGAITHLQSGPPSSNVAGTLTSNPPFTAETKGNIMNSSWVATAGGTGGINNTYGAQSTSSKWSYYDGGRFVYGNTDEPGGAPALLFTGTYKAVSNGLVTISIDREPGTVVVWYADVDLVGEDATTRSKIAETVIGTSAQIQVGGAGPTTSLPTVSITTGDVLEGDWSDEGGWNNPLHTVHIDATGSANDEGQTLAWLWQITNNTGVTKDLAATTGSFDLTISELADLFKNDGGLPGPYASGEDKSADPAYNWTLTATVTDLDGSVTSAPITVFVPEPTTIGLLGFGIVSAILKRRRRA